MTTATPRATQTPPSALPVGTRLGEFEIRGLLGVGGFGIVYLAWDHQLEREVAIKEYMPSAMVGRTDTLHVSLRSASDAETFALGLKSFVNEGKMLARFDHPALLKVYRFWEAHGTAYMAMPVLRGQSLKAIRQGGQQAVDEAWLRTLLTPLLEALGKLHGQGVFHRDIAPDNIHIEADGHPVLLDFGAARHVLSDRTQNLTAILKPAYAPIEQYAEAGSVRQGPWTDLYALGATLHFLLIGKPPAPATARTVQDEGSRLDAAACAGTSERFLALVDWMLQPRPGDRPASVAEVQAVLRGEREPPPRRSALATAEAARPTSPPDHDWAHAPTVVVPAPAAPPAQPAPPALHAAPLTAPAAPARRSAWPVLMAAAVLLAAGGGWWAASWRTAGVDTPSAAVSAAASAAVESPSALPPLPAQAETAVATVVLPGAGLATAAAPLPPPLTGASAVKVNAPAAPRPEPKPARAEPRPEARTETRTAPPVAVEAARPVGAAAAAPAKSADAPAPAPAVETPPAAAEPPTPEAICRGQNPLMYLVCMERECLKRAQMGTADCKKWRASAQRQEP